MLTGSLLRFLPGYALVSGFRDLIDGSVVSGTARLAEALLLAAAVAGGAVLSLAVASTIGVTLQLQVAGFQAWSLPISVAASVLAVGAYAVRLGVPPLAMAQAAPSGHSAGCCIRRRPPRRGCWTLASRRSAVTIFIGVLGRLLARRFGAPAALWVVPAILPLLPGLQLVQAMLAETNVARIDGLIAAAGTAFVIGTGVAMGDILVLLIRGVRRSGRRPAVGAVAGGVEVLIVAPMGRVVERARHVERRGATRSRMRRSRPARPHDARQNDR